MEPENRITPSGSKRPTKTVDLNDFSEEALLENLANSPCASRQVPSQQSLEDYLQSTKSREQVKKNGTNS